MVYQALGVSAAHELNTAPVQVIRHAQVCAKLQISSAKLFDLIAKGLFPKPFQLIPGGRAVGWLECDVNSWVLSRKENGKGQAE
jgi:prophage regulatory protein